MQNPNNGSGNLSLIAVKEAINAIKERGWDVNPFTVADEIKVSRADIYRHIEIMKLIINARGGTFGMDVGTALDLVWQLHKLEEQNKELKKKLGLPEDDQQKNVVVEKSGITGGETLSPFAKLKNGGSSAAKNSSAKNHAKQKTNPPKEPLREAVIPDIQSIDWILLDQDNILSDTDTGDMPVVSTISINSKASNADTISGDELRDLIQAHIKNAVDKMLEYSKDHPVQVKRELESWLNNSSSTKKNSNSANYTPRNIPPEIRKSCLILGVRPDGISYETVQNSWKKAIAAPNVHPDLGGDSEIAVYINTAKDTLIQWLDTQAPKLGKQFKKTKKK